jgi:hypothetical protein
MQHLLDCFSELFFIEIRSASPTGRCGKPEIRVNKPRHETPEGNECLLGLTRKNPAHRHASMLVNLGCVAHQEVGKTGRAGGQFAKEKDRLLGN